MMICLRILNTLILFFISISFSYAQYIGGSADGFASNTFIASACPALPNTNIYFGGVADGFADGVFIASACPALPNTNIYFGGVADGFADGTFIAAVCPPQPNTNIYFGGVADGFADGVFIAAVCPPQPNTNIYFGGVADGFADGVFIASACPPKPNTNIYFGGIADGAVFGLLIVGACAVLPIELLSFTAAPDREEVDIKWETATEINNNYFTIDRSQDGQNFTVLTTINSKANHGNSTAPLNYQTTDSMPYSGTSYYRLKQTDYNNNYKYFNIVSVNFSGQQTIIVYPNPNNGTFVIQTNTSTKQSVQVYDVNGKVVLSQTINGKTSIDASTLNEGVYNISLLSNEGIINKRLVIVR